MPVSVNFSGKVSTDDGERPPRVRRISIAFNRHGRISTRGLPVCQADQLQSVTTRTALERCGGALLGRGRFAARVDFVSSGFSVRGVALAFNAMRAGRPLILLHVYSRAPIQSAFVLAMKISHPAAGEFGTVISTTVPKIAGGAGYLTALQLSFGRDPAGGARRSFLSASCSAPAGFPGAVFTLARARFEFADGRHSSISLTRSCAVR